MIGGILQHLMLTNAQAKILFLSILYSILQVGISLIYLRLSAVVVYQCKTKKIDSSRQRLCGVFESRAENC